MGSKSGSLRGINPGGYRDDRGPVKKSHPGQANASKRKRAKRYGEQVNQQADAN